MKLTNTSINNLTKVFELIKNHAHNQTKPDKTATYERLSYGFCIGLATYFIFLIICGFMFNTWLIYTICKDKNLHKTNHFLVINLAISNLMSSYNLLFDSIFLLRHQYYDYGVFFCGSSHIIYLSLLPLCIISVLLLTVEKLLTFIFPLSHNKYINKKTGMALVILVWMYSGIVGAFPVLSNTNAVVVHKGDCYLLLTNTYKVYQLLVNFSIPLVCIVVMNLFIYRIVMRCAASRRKLSNGSHCISEQAIRWKAARTVLIVVGNETLCWFIYITGTVISIVCGEWFPPEVPWIINAINYTSVATNPLIYGLLTKSVRRSAFKVCNCFFLGKGKEGEENEDEVIKLQRDIS